MILLLLALTPLALAFNQLNISDCFYRLDRAVSRTPYSIHEERSYLLHGALGENKGIYILNQNTVHFFAFPKEKPTGPVLVLKVSELPRLFLHLDPDKAGRFWISEEGREDPWTKKLLIKNITQALPSQMFDLQEPVIRNILTRDLELRLEPMLVKLTENLEIVRTKENEVDKEIALVRQKKRDRDEKVDDNEMAVRESRLKQLYANDSAYRAAQDHLKSAQWPGTANLLQSCRFIWGGGVVDTSGIDSAIDEVKRLEERYSDL